MHQIAIAFQWGTAIVILIELSFIFVNLGNRVYSLLYMLCTSMLVSAYGYLLHLNATTEDALILTSMVVWAGKIFALVVAWRFCLSVCESESPKKVQIVDHIGLGLVLAGLTSTRVTGFFFSDFHVMKNDDWYFLGYHRGIGYYLYYIFVICALGFMLQRYIRAIRNTKDKNRKKQFAILMVSALFSPGMGLLSMLPVGDYYDFGQIGFLACSITMVIAMIKYNIGDIEQFTKDYMFNELSSGVIATEKNGKGTFYNKIALSIFPELKTDSPKVLEELHEAISSGNTVSSGDRIYSPEEKLLENKSSLLILTDMTRHYQHVSELEEQRKLAEAANKAKSDFLANMSHEIRTPINTVLGMDEMILRESGEDTIREYAMDIRSAVQSLLSIINDILDLSKIEAGKMEIIPVEYDVSSSINDVSNMVRFRAEDKELAFHIAVSPAIPSKLYGDDIRIRQILTNLLTNAIKYTKTGSVWLRIAPAESANGNAELVTLHYEVEDTGAGIKKEDMEKLFSSFERIDLEQNRNIEGTGLGIPITMKLLELMGSRLVVQSEYGKGSLFSFDLIQKVVDAAPIGDFEESIRKHVSQQSSRYNSFAAPDTHILLVDDNSMNRKVFTSLLKQTGIGIDEADNGETAVAKASETHYDIIFMDHMMPGMDGVEAMKRIKDEKDGPNAKTPIIVLTANAVTGAREQYFEDGFDGYLSKPVNADKLEGVLLDTLPEGSLAPIQGGDIKREAKTGEPFDTEKLPVIFGLDWNVAMMRLQKKEILDAVLEEFSATIDQQADRLENYKADLPGSFADYRILVHAMKSSSGVLGMIPISGMAAVLEKAAAEEDSDTIERMHPVFIREWRSYKDRLKEYLEADDTDENEKEEIPEEILLTLLGMLSAAMEEMDIDGADDAIKKLSSYKLPKELDEVYDELKAAVVSLDQEKTADIIENISI